MYVLYITYVKTIKNCLKFIITQFKIIAHD